jgi:non-specific serine/threonine protein kinase
MPLTPLLGREREEAELFKQLREPTIRLVTLTGPGGVGKTHLALHLAVTLPETFPDGVAFVGLALVTDRAMVPSAVAAAFSLQAQAGEPILKTLTRALSTRRVLLVLDNCEHVSDVCGAVVRELLESCPNLTILATSRESLHLSGEMTWPVPPLTVPPRVLVASTGGSLTSAILHYDSVRLFCERAMAVEPSFAVTEQNAGAIAAICRRLDGLPLAIELAASHVSTLTSHDLARRLEQRLKLLPIARRDLYRHQQTLEATIAWSYDLLKPQERRLFQWLAVFAGAFTLEAAERVCSEGVGDQNAQRVPATEDLLAGVSSLVQKSLLRRVDSDPEPRFAMLETIRGFAEEKLHESGDAVVVRWRHSTCYLALAETIPPAVWQSSAEEIAWLDRFEDERDNVWTAMDWVASNPDSVAGLRWAAALGWFWWWRAYNRALPPGLADSWLEGSSGPGLARARRGSSERSARLSRARGLFGAAYAAWRRGDYATADGRFEEGCRAWTAGTNDDRAEVSSYSEWGLQVVTHWERHDGAAQKVLEEALARYADQGDRPRTGAMLVQLGWLELFREDWSTAEKRFADAEHCYEELVDAAGLAAARFGRGWVAQEQGDLATARAHYLATLRLLGQDNALPVAPFVLTNWARLADASGDQETAVQLAGAALGPRMQNASRLPSALIYLLGQTVGHARQTLGETRFAAAWETGRSLRLDQASALVRSSEGLG